jgi:PRC-barrel domain
MLHSLAGLRHFHIHASDGDIGQIVDSYFDDERWVVRYLVARTGGWLSGREVLISPYSIDRVDESAHAIRSRLKREQVQLSPSVDTAQPISRREEAALLSYYGYPLYWPYASFWAWGAEPTVMPELPAPLDPDAAAESRQDPEVHLRSAREVNGYHVEGSDDAVGHVEDFLFEDSTWAIRYLVVDTRNWLPGRRVLISSQWLREVSWPERIVEVDLTRAAIEHSPGFDPDHLPTREDEADLHRHYRRPSYWGDYPPGR